MVVVVQSIFLSILSIIAGCIYILTFKSIGDTINDTSNDGYNYLFYLILSISMLKLKNSILLILIIALFYYINYRKNIFISTLISGLYWGFIYIPIKHTSIDLISSINSNSLNPHSVIFDIETLIMQNILMLIAFSISNQISKFKGVKNLNIKFDYKSIIIPILIDIVLIISVFRILAIDTVLTNFDISTLIITTIILIVSKFNHLNLLGKNMYSYVLDYENRVIKENILTEQNYYKKINKEKDKVRSLYHDMKNHIICINSLCEEGDIAKIKKYIDSMDINLLSFNKLSKDIKTGNMILDSILRVKKEVCLEKKIDFLIDVDFSKSDFMDMIDICTIFSNLIDNAIEACDKIENQKIHKTITLKSRYIDKFNIILIENTKVNNIKKGKFVFLTNKNNSYMHGIGLKNVVKTVEKYFGQANFNHQENKFKVKILIPYD